MGAKKTRSKPRTGAKRVRREQRAAARTAAPAPAEPPKPARDPEGRREFFDRAGEHTPYLGVAAEEGRFLLATSDRGVGMALYIKQSRPEFVVLRRVVSVLESELGRDAVRNRLFVDVGANIGTTTVCALLVHGFGAAVSCEPEAENNQLLRANLALNDLEDRVETLQVAVSSKPGSASFVIVEDRRGQSWVALDPEKIEAAQALRTKRLTEDPNALEAPIPYRPAELSELTVEEVELVSLDQLCESGVIELDRAGLVWIDAEGHEGHILTGGSAVTGRGVPVVLEFHPEGLDDRGDREMIHDIAEEHYTHFVDVRRLKADRPDERLQPRPVKQLRAHAERFLDPSNPVVFTDVLLLRLA